MLVSEQLLFWLYHPNCAGAALLNFLYLKMALLLLIQAKTAMTGAKLSCLFYSYIQDFIQHNIRWSVLKCFTCSTNSYFPANRNRNRVAEPTSVGVGIGIVWEFPNLQTGKVFANYSQKTDFFVLSLFIGMSFSTSKPSKQNPFEIFSYSIQYISKYSSTGIICVKLWY